MAIEVRRAGTLLNVACIAGAVIDSIGKITRAKRKRNGYNCHSLHPGVVGHRPLIADPWRNVESVRFSTQEQSVKSQA